MREVLADGIEIWLDDFREVVPHIQSVSHVITDPPYEQLMHDLHGSTELHRTDGGSERKGLTFSGIDELRPEFVAFCKRACAGWLLGFCNVDGVLPWRQAIEAAKIKWCLACIWVKPDATPKMNGQGPAIGYECIVTAWCGKGHSRWNGGGKRGVFTHLTNNPERDGEHTTEKPLSLMRELISLFTQPGDVVCDPFMGSGTTGVACVQLGRKFIGVEKDAGYYAIAKRRIEAALRQPDLFVEVPKMKQGKLEI